MPVAFSVNWTNIRITGTKDIDLHYLLAFSNTANVDIHWWAKEGGT